MCASCALPELCTNLCRPWLCSLHGDVVSAGASYTETPPHAEKAPSKGPGDSGSTRDLQPLIPRGISPHKECRHLVLVSGCGVCFYTRLHHAKCKHHFKCNLPAPCAGTHVPLTHVSLAHMCMQLAAAVHGWWGHPNPRTEPHHDSLVGSKRCEDRSPVAPSVPPQIVWPGAL